MLDWHADCKNQLPNEHAVTRIPTVFRQETQKQVYTVYRLHDDYTQLLLRLRYLAHVCAETGRNDRQRRCVEAPTTCFCYINITIYTVVGIGKTCRKDINKKIKNKHGCLI